MSKDVRSIFEDVFSKQRTRALWTANYLPAIPFSTQHFDIGSILPAMLYMIRWGHRRGRGAFEKTFGATASEKLASPTVARVADGLLERGSRLHNFGSADGRALLGDLLLAWCLENKKHEMGHDEQVQRTFPTHYLSSWIDLPKSTSDLRGVPEFLVALLAAQEQGAVVVSSSGRERYPVAVGFDPNPLLSLFGRHMTVRGERLTDIGMADQLLEEDAMNLGIDEILAVRIAEACRHAPYKAKGKDENEQIPNQHALAKHAAARFRDDLRVLIEVYGPTVPRQAFLQMFESAVALGLTNVLLSTTGMLLHWEQSGRLPSAKEQRPWPLFVDTSQGLDPELRALSEASVTDTFRRYERLPVITMLLRVLEDKFRDLELTRSPPRTPDATEYINVLGTLLHGSHDDSGEVIKDLRKDCRRLADELAAEGELPEVVASLLDAKVASPVRFAEAVVELMGRTSTLGNYYKALESCFMTDRTNGLVVKRRVKRSENGTQRSVDLRSIVLTSTLLDFLVHRHLRKATKGLPERFLSLRQFLDILRTDYGLHVDQAPPGLPVSQALLLRNKQWLERRLRDLGLLVGVNDAESMKQLKGRYQPRPSSARI